MKSVKDFSFEKQNTGQIRKERGELIMKYFSLSFRTEKTDYENYYRDFGKAMLINQVKKSLIPMVIMIVLFVFLSSYDTMSYYIPFAFFLIISLFMPLFYSKKLSFFLLSSRQMKRENIFDFYADHIEIHVLPDESGRSTTEKHFKMKGFTAVTESKTNFYFSYMNERTMIIPKRVLDEEKYTMIKNLIENYFSNVYLSI